MINLNRRERNIVAACAGLVLIALAHWLVVSPTLRKSSDLDASISRAQNQLKELKLLKHEYDQILQETRMIKRRMDEQSPDSTLSVSSLEQIATGLAIADNLTSMKPSRRALDSSLAEDMVEVRLEGISLENLVAYIYAIEKNGPAIAISNIRIQPESRLEGGLNVSMLATSIASIK